VDDMHDIYSGGRERGRRGGNCPDGTVQGAAFGGAKYGILKFGCFWRIDVCITDSDILQPLTLPQFWDNTP